MARTLTADRSALIRLASTLPKGSPERRAILAGLSLVAADYKTYVEKAKKDGKKPMEQDEWEARFGDKSKKKKKDDGGGGSKSLKKILDNEDISTWISRGDSTALNQAMKGGNISSKGIDRLVSSLEKNFGEELEEMGGWDGAKSHLKGLAEKRKKFESSGNELLDVLEDEDLRERFRGFLDGDPSAGSPDKVISALEEQAKSFSDADKKEFKAFMSQMKAYTKKAHSRKGDILPRTLTASDRKSLIRLASTLPKGSPERKAILKGLSSLSKSATHPFPDGVLTKAEYSQLPDPRDWKGYTFAVYYQWDGEGEAVDDPENGYGIPPRIVEWLDQVPDAVHSSRLSDTFLDDYQLSKKLRWKPRMYGRGMWLESTHPDEPMMYYRVVVQRNDRQRLSRAEVDYLTKAFR